MDKSRLSKKAIERLQDLKEDLNVSSTDKKTIEYIIFDYDYMRKENNILRGQNEMLKLKLQNG